MSSASWALAKQADAPENSGKTAAQVQMMQGYASTTKRADAISTCIDDIMCAAIEKSAEAQKADQQSKHFNTKGMRVLKRTKDAVNYMLCDRGFLPSMEGGKLMLDENVKVMGKDGAEYAKQHWVDKTHDAAVANVLEFATGLGSDTAARKEQLCTDAFNSIKEVAGEATAKRVQAAMLEWNDQIVGCPESPAEKTVWSLKERQAKRDAIVATCISADPVAAEVTRKVHKFSNHNKVATRGSQAVETTLNAVSLSPTMAGPAAQAALLGFFMLTGGCEEDKLISEMYLGKRIQSRKESITNQANMAIDGHQLGLATNNAPLRSCSESLIRRLGGPDLWAKIFMDGTQTATQAATQAATPSTVQSETPPKVGSSTLPGIN